VDPWCCGCLGQTVVAQGLLMHARGGAMPCLPPHPGVYRYVATLCVWQDFVSGVPTRLRAHAGQTAGHVCAQQQNPRHRPLCYSMSPTSTSLSNPKSLSLSAASSSSLSASASSRSGVIMRTYPRAEQAFFVYIARNVWPGPTLLHGGRSMFLHVLQLFHCPVLEPLEVVNVRHVLTSGVKPGHDMSVLHQM